MDKHDLLRKLDRLARDSPYAGEREVAARKAAHLRAKLTSGTGKVTGGGGKQHGPNRREHVSTHFVDVGHTTDIKDAFREAFGAAFHDIRMTMRNEGTSKPCPKGDDPETVVKRMGMKVRYK